MTLLNSANPEISAAQERLFDSFRTRSRFVMATDQQVLFRAVANQHKLREDDARALAIEAAALELNCFRVEPCAACHGTGYVAVDVPVFAGGNYSDVEQVAVECACNQPPSDADAPDWGDVPELWAEDYPGIDYDATLPAHLLA